MNQGQAVQLAPTDAELERAIASVPGVVSASIDRSETSGRSRMRLRLAPGEDEEAVAWAVAATLRERFGIALDPDAIRPRTVAASAADDPVRMLEDEGSDGTDALDQPVTEGRSGAELSATREALRRAAEKALDVLGSGSGDAASDADAAPEDAAPAADLAPDGPAPDPTLKLAPFSAVPAPGGPPTGQVAIAAASAEATTIIPRAAIVDLEIQRHPSSVEVFVVLEHEGRREQGRAVAVPTKHGTLRAVAEATVGALRALTEGSLLVGIERVTVQLHEDAPMATVTLSLLTRRGEERLLGASIVRDSADRAVMRATLDALNRRVTPLLLERTAEFDAAL